MNALAKVLIATIAAATPSPEVQFAMQSLRPGERARIEKALGPIDQLPLYRVDLKISPTEGAITGRVQVEVHGKGGPLSRVLLRVTPNATDPDRVKLSNASANGKPAKLLHPEPTLFEVPVDPPSDDAVIELELSATLPRLSPQQPLLMTMLSGMNSGSRQASDHGAFGMTDEAASAIGVVPEVAPEGSSAPSGIGDLALYEPAHFLASIRVPSGWRAFSNGVPLGEVPEQDGFTRYSFAIAAARDFPLLAAKGYESQTATVDDVTVESWFCKADAEQGARALSHGRAALAELQKRLGPYPYRTLRIIEAPLTDGAGGMEFPGLFTVATMLYRDGANPFAALGLPQSPDGQDLLGDVMEFTVAHETAHQWFAGLVGSDPIEHPVVDESLAQYVATLYVEWRHGRDAAKASRQNNLMLPFQIFLMLGGVDARADQSTAAFASELQYGAVVYGKAPLLHEAERKLLGDAAFLRGLRAYVDAHRYQWVGPEALTDSLAQQSPGSARKLRELRRRWWEEKHGNEDLGAADLNKLLRQFGMSGDAQMDQQTQELFREAIKALSGSGP